MLGSALRKNQDVIYVAVAEIQSSKSFVHEALECLSRVAKTKCHERELEQSERCGDRRLWNIFFMHSNLVVRLYQIYSGENSHTSQLTSEVLDMPHRVSIWDRTCV